MRADPPRPLDFLVNGQLLRQSLQQLMLDSNTSAVRPCRGSTLILAAIAHLPGGCNLTPLRLSRRQHVYQSA